MYSSASCCNVRAGRVVYFDVATFFQAMECILGARGNFLCAVDTSSLHEVKRVLDSVSQFDNDRFGGSVKP